MSQATGNKVNDIMASIGLGVILEMDNQLDLAVAQLQHPDGREGVVGGHDLGLEDLLAARVATFVGAPLLDPLAGLHGARRRLVVRMDRDAAESLAEGAVAEGVVEVLMGVEHRRHGPDPERSDVIDDRACRTGRRLGVDDQQTVRTADETHVQVEPLLPGHPHPVGHLSESRHTREPSKVGTPGR